MDATFALYGQRDDPTTKKHYQPFLCTAFIFQKDATGYLLLSAGHCIEGSPVDSTFAVAEQMGGELHSVTPVSARKESVDDYVVFHWTTDRVYPVLQLGDEITESIGSAEINPNFSFGVVKQLAHGVISSDLIDKPDIISDCDVCVGRFILEEMAGGGASGSPVISATTHKVIGVLVIQLETAGFGIEPISTVKAAMQRPNQFKDLHKIRIGDIFLWSQQGDDPDE